MLGNFCVLCIFWNRESHFLLSVLYFIIVIIGIITIIIDIIIIVTSSSSPLLSFCYHFVFIVIIYTTLAVLSPEYYLLPLYTITVTIIAIAVANMMFNEFVTELHGHKNIIVVLFLSSLLLFQVINMVDRRIGVQALASSSISLSYCGRVLLPVIGASRIGSDLQAAVDKAKLGKYVILASSTLPLCSMRIYLNRLVFQLYHG